MNDLEKMAIILIYPDGEIEKIPITSHVYHIEYLAEHREKSQRFARVTIKCDFTDTLHEDIDTALVTNGVIVIFNLNIYDIVRNPNYLTEEKPDFTVFFPSELGSIGQISNYESIMGSYPLDNISPGLFDKNTNYIDDIEHHQVEEFLANAKSLLNGPKL
ncbi:MAG: hypothetical protein NC483_03200 [Ruminococcus sp.]|nr:hypothetical protein [Ruminococcus sp.]